MLIEIHMLQSYGPSNPNRDDLSAQKTALFGDVLRARISSQCIKRSVRRNAVFQEDLKGLLGTRTVFFPDDVLREMIALGIPEEESQKAVSGMLRLFNKGEEKKGKKKKGKETPEEKERARTSQVIFVGPNEAIGIANLFFRWRREDNKLYKILTEGGELKKVTKELKELKEIYDGKAVDIALFGRMITSDAFENIEASMQVAHAISTHGVIPEVDYYTTVDDNPTEGQTGSDFIGEFIYSSSVFYKYFSLDFSSFAKSLGNEEIAKNAAGVFLEAAALAIPSGKRNSFANNSLPDAILVEVRNRGVQTSYVNAFLSPASNFSDSTGKHDILDDSIRKLRQYSKKLLHSYDLIDGTKRFWFSTREMPVDVADERIINISTLKALKESLLKELSEE